jgi:hypothetical protein
MSVLSDTLRQLQSRRLLPVALLLVAALAAVPFLLAKDPEPTAAPVTAAPKAETATASASAATAEPIVTLVQEGERTKRRRVLGARKNPFEPAPVKLAKPSTTRSTTARPADTGGTPVDTKTGSGGGSPVSGPVVVPTLPTVPTVPAPTTPKKAYELYSLTVRFGSATGTGLARMNLGRLKALPSVEEPILVYLGVSQDKKTAIFMVDSSVVAQGDGTCKPHPSNCETIHMNEGETEFFDVVDEQGNVSAQYQLDLVDIKQRKTADAAQARKARAKASAAGRVLLEARTSAQGPLRYRYDPRTGTVRRLGEKAFKAAVAKLATAAAAAE